MNINENKRFKSIGYKLSAGRDNISGKLIKIPKINQESIKVIDYIKEDIILITQKISPPMIPLLKPHINIIKGILCRESTGMTGHGKMLIESLYFQSEKIHFHCDISEKEYNNLNRYKKGIFNWYGIKLIK